MVAQKQTQKPPCPGISALCTLKVAGFQQNLCMSTLALIGCALDKGSVPTPNLVRCVCLGTLCHTEPQNLGAEWWGSYSTPWDLSILYGILRTGLSTGRAWETRKKEGQTQSWHSRLFMIPLQIWFHLIFSLTLGSKKTEQWFFSWVQILSLPCTCFVSLDTTLSLSFHLCKMEDLRENVQRAFGVLNTKSELIGSYYWYL